MKRFLFTMLFLCSCAPADDEARINGYIEGEYVSVAPSAGGVLDKVYVVKGQTVEKGSRLFTVDGAVWRAKLAQAESGVQEARARLAQSRALQTNAEQEFRRARQLLKTQNASQAAFDSKESALKNAKAKTTEAESAVSSAEQNLILLREQAARQDALSAVGGTVSDVYFRTGEFVSAGTAVVSILPPENVKVRFFVPETTFARLRYKQRVFVSCDNGGREFPAEISYLASAAEYTPPVIYSTESRQKLVFMVEAVFLNPEETPNVGLPVSVRVE